MNKSRLYSSTVLLVAILVSSCNLPNASPVIVTPTSSGMDQQTLVALAVQQTKTSAALLAPQISLTPSLTSTITFTTTPEVSMVTVSQSTNCRTGPGEPYDIVGILPAGTPAEVVGRNEFGDTWIIKLPSNPSITCWLWGHWGTVTGDTSRLPVLVPPATPTPSGNFYFGYAGFGVGPGYQCFLFNITNTGGMTWESFNLSLDNTTIGANWSVYSDVFTRYDNWCGVTDYQLNLEAGEYGTAGVFTYMVFSFVGNWFEAVLTLCSGNGMSGYCMTDTYFFTP